MFDEELTSIKYRDKLYRKKIDYIFYKGFDLVKTKRMPNSLEID